MRYHIFINPILAYLTAAVMMVGCSQSMSIGLPTISPIPTVPVTVPPTQLPSAFPAIIQLDNPAITSTTTSNALAVNPAVSPAVLTPTSPPLPLLPTAASVEKSRVKIFLVAPNDNGKSGPKIGCNDSLVAVDRDIKPTQAVLTAALNELFAIKTQSYGQSGLITALYQSNLQLKSAQVVNGRMIVHLMGNYKLGRACDMSRFKEQISATVRQFSTTTNAAIFINDAPLESIK
ncbi:MAG: hypothetical protein WCL57_12665 [Chloroflexota bacterium]|jgi:hypothetical protein|nr:GerMN domain-containing protein [Chloroflexota bacterium]